MIEHIDESALAELREIMGDDFSLLIETFIADSKLRLDAINEAINQQDSEALRTSAHSFKGSALNISAQILTELCKQLEFMGRDNEMEDALKVFEQTKEEFVNVNALLDKL